MVSSASWEVQKAIINRLTADTAIQNLVGNPARVFDYATESVDFPYIEYKENSTQEWDTDLDIGKEHTISLNVWSRAEGSKETWLILRAIESSLQDFTSLTLNDHNHVNMRFLFSDLVRDPDGQTYHGIAQYRIITEEV